MKINKVLICLIIVTLIVMNKPIINLVIAETNPFDIGTEYDKLLFNLKNMKPGDQVSKVLTVQNRGSRDFTYNTEAKFIGGYKPLYDEFLLTIWDSKNVIFNGKLANFQKLEPRFLRTKHQEDLKFRVIFPFELGNEFQGKSFEYEIRFIVEGVEPKPDPDPNPNPDPNPVPNPNPNPGPDSVPTAPTQPSEPGINSEDPTEPDNPIETNEGGPLKPERPISPEDLDKGPTEGQILPSTATNTYNLLLSGVVLLALGSILLYFRYRKINRND